MRRPDLNHPLDLRQPAHRAGRPALFLIWTADANAAHPPRMLQLVLAAAAILYPATVVHAIDGDTVKVVVAGWPAPFTPIDVRINGIDTPEHVKPPAKKVCEVKLGIKAMVYARTLVKPGDAVVISWTPGDHDKYGRILGAVALADGSDWGAKMIAGGYARPYGVTTGPGALTKKPWC